MDGESLQDCAEAGGFDLPATVTHSITSTIVVPGPSSAPSAPGILSPISALPLPATALTPVAPAPSQGGLPLPGGMPYPTGASSVPAKGTGALPSPSTTPLVVVTAAAPRMDRGFFGVGAVLGAMAAVFAMY